MYIKQIVIILFILLIDHSAFATIYYADNSLVSNCTSGSYSITKRTCTGSDGNAYTTIQGAVNVATTPGDIVDVRSGTYPEKVVTTAAGSDSSHYITIQAHSGETPLLYDSSGVNGAGFSINHAYIKIDGFEGTGLGTTSDGSRAFIYINRGTSAGNYAYITNCYVHNTTKEGKDGTGKGTRGIYIKEPSVSASAAINASIINNTFSCMGHITLMLYGNNHLAQGNNITGCYNAVSLNWNDYDAIWIFGDNTVIRSNNIQNLDGTCGDSCERCSAGCYKNHTDAFQTFGAATYSESSQNVIIEKNFIKNIIDGQVIMMEANGYAISDWTFRNNIIQNTGLPINTYAKNIKIYNNLFEKVSNAEFIGYDQHPIQCRYSATKGTCSGMEVKKNIFIGCGGTSLTQGWYGKDTGAGSITADNNYAANSDYTAKSGFTGLESNGVSGGNPYLANDGGSLAKDYALTSQSVKLIKAGGLPIASFSDDYISAHRPTDSAWDIGPFQYSDSSDPHILILP